MIIGIDGNEANVEKRVGVSTYTLNLLQYFKNNSSNITQFIVYLKNPPNADLPASSKYFQYKIVPGKLFWSQIFLPVHLYRNKNIDVFFSPAHYIPRFCPVPTVVTIHDLSYLYFPNEFLKSDLFKLKNWTEFSINHAKKIIAVSKTTKKDILKNYQIPDEKVEVVYNGFEKKVNSHFDKAQREQFLILNSKLDKYILYVGTLQPRKNISILLQAFNIFIKTNPEYKLIIAGKKGWLYEKIFSEVEYLGIKNKVKFVGFVNDQRLISLYKSAFCFVMPSLYEGFGIPILEAMNFNCPVISSFSSSLPEIGSDACLYFDPDSKNDLLDKLNSLVNNENLRKELIKKGQKRIKDFSWSKCGKETLDIIKSAIK